jgi:hypothetical protein
VLKSFFPSSTSQGSEAFRTSVEDRLVRRLQHACFIGGDRALCDSIWQEAAQLDLDVHHVVDRMFAEEADWSDLHPQA